jgi:hypothetical protein
MQTLGTVIRGIGLSLAAFALSVPVTRAADPVEFGVGAFTFERPDGWQWIVPSSPMRKAQLNVPGEGAPAEVTFFHFGAGQGGGIPANVDRWFGQFQDAKTSQTREIYGKTPVTIVRASGTFQSGMPGGQTTSMPGYALLGAILESPGGDVFVKMTGPGATVAASGDSFLQMIKTSAAK